MNSHLKALIWTCIPNHYQGAFHESLRRAGVDLRVCYYERIGAERTVMNWDSGDALPEGEFYVESLDDARRCIPDLAERIHVVPGYGSKFTRTLALLLVRNKFKWVHWSEPSHGGLQWLKSWPLKLAYGHCVRKHALGAFAIGEMALSDFKLWGIPSSKIAYLPYSTPESADDIVIDSVTRDFVGQRLAFMFAGSLCLRKGIDLLLKAFDVVAGRNPDCCLILVGNDALPGGMESWLKPLRHRDRILLRGPIPPSNLDGVLCCGHVFVLPSRFDGWGLALCEGARAGMALISTSRAGAARHVIEPSVNGFRVRSGCVRSLSDAMSFYAEQPTRTEIHGAYSRRLYAQTTPQVNAMRFIHAILSWPVP
jgi:glycosyltransferase involved in cell wall biosynthesis